MSETPPMISKVSEHPDWPGMVIHHDIRNENHLARNGVLRAVAAPGTEAMFKPATKMHRQYQHFDQGNNPSCTGYGTATYLATAHEYTKSNITGAEWYARNVAFDESQGRFYDGGATCVAAFEVAKKAGAISAYQWMYTVKEMQQAILIRPIVMGTNWYYDMWERDNENIIKFKASDPGQNVGGHFYVLNGYDAHRDLWRNPETWGDGDYWIPGDVMYRLLREDGECAIAVEIPKLQQHPLV